ncbi:MAG: hypothetical protein ACKVRO_18575 [Micropepsaceae bacterium]
MTADDLISPELVSEARAAIVQYADARRRFRAVQERLKAAGLLVGNDNKVGVIGEFWAIQDYRARGFRLQRVPPHTNNAGFDFVVSKVDVPIKVSVKAITAENSRGKTSLVHANGDWDELCIVQMDEILEPVRFGCATKEQFLLRFGDAAAQRPANVRWLDQGWMSVWPKGSV